jgi:cytoplasmic iron level regulating protein YaaA (DUF328/UPF0246 family)
MLIIVPSSEGKRSADAGAPLDLTRLSSPSLTPTRERLIGALIATSGRPDAHELLGVGASLADAVAANRELRSLPTLPAGELYDGVLHRALDLRSLDARSRARAADSLRFASTLFGLLRPDDRIPPYRLPVGARLLDTPRLERLWREPLSAVFSETAKGPILDLRAASYRVLGSAAGADGRTLVIALGPGVGGGNVTLKRLRGLAARRLLAAPESPVDLASLVALFAREWRVELVAPANGRGPSTLCVTP